MKNTKVLLGFGLLGLALASFWIMLTKSDVAMAQYNVNRNEFVYQGIDNVSENVYSLNFLDRNIMFLTGGLNGVFHMSKIPVIILGSIGNNWGISNILGGNDISLGNSDNITVIGGDELKVEDDNSNATLLGGYRNSIEGGMSSDTPVVLLGGMENTVGFNHDANVIVGGSTNGIKPESQNVNILGGNEVTVYGDNIIAGGERIQGGFSDSFIFNDGENLVSGDGSGMFFMKVANGVGFGTGTQEGNKGAISNGAVKLGNIDIENVACSTAFPENVGLIGLWNGCVVGCTSGSADLMHWELLDYGDRCEKLCSLFPAYCTQGNIDEGAADYTGFCTEGIVSTENAHMCNPEGLDLYKNVVFETYLIDSDDSCPLINSANNQCAFQCNEHYHLTGDQTGKRGGVTMCFEDCKLPWDASQYTGHNGVITAYSRNVVYCSSDTGYHDTCGPYKTQLMCIDGKWYNMSGSEATDLENLDYNYLSCNLTEYHCGPDFVHRKELVDKMQDFMSIWRYTESKSDTKKALEDIGFLEGKIVPGINLKFSEIGSWKDDEPKEKEGVKQFGVRGVYELCVEYIPHQPQNQYPENEYDCVESSATPDQYRYRFLECNEGYDLAPEDGVCRKQCNYNGWTVKHGSGMILYTGLDAHCPDACHAQKFQCYDGTLYTVESLKVVDGKFVDGIPQASTPYIQPICSLTGEVCEGFIVNSGDYLLNQYIGTFTPCNRYSPSGILACTYLNTMYRLESCNANYYSNSARTGCNECPNGDGYHYVSNTGSDQISDCSITCTGANHVAIVNSGCEECPVGKASYHHIVTGGSVSFCNGCTNKPSNSHYTSNGSGGLSSCKWGCDTDYYRNSAQTGCNECDTPKYHTDGSGAIQRDQCYTVCSGGYYVAEAGHDCEPCPVGSGSVEHPVSGGNTSICQNCTNGPINNACYHYISNGPGGSTTCTWQCSSDCYLSGTYPNGRCDSCPSGVGYKYTSNSGSTNISGCLLTCTGANHVAIVNSGCEACPIGKASYHHTVTGGSVSFCNGCTNKPSNSHYTSNGSGGLSSCKWGCDTDYYRNSAQTGCNECDPQYHKYHTTEIGSGATKWEQCIINCDPGFHVSTPGGQCEPCPAGVTIAAHSVTGGGISTCTTPCPLPTGAQFITGAQDSCSWECITGYYLNSAGTGCTPCPPSYVTYSAGATGEDACRTGCIAGTHVATPREMCELCGTGKTTTTINYVSSPNTFQCADCPSTSKPEHSHFIANTPTKACNWECDTTFIKSENSCICSGNNYYDSVTNKCKPCQNGYTSAPGLGGVNSCLKRCNGGTHVVTPRGSCQTCDPGYAMPGHNQSATGTSVCTGCTNGPTNKDVYPLNSGYIYTSYGTEINPTNCPWQCGSGYYSSGTNNNKKCVPCTGGYYTPDGPGAEQRSQCKINCPAGTHVKTPGGPCVPCSGGYTIGAHSVPEGSSETCTIPCGTLPQNAQYIEGAQDSCSWECKAGYYKNAAQTGCNECPNTKGVYFSDTGAESRESCFIRCEAGTHVAEVDGPCVECEGGSTTSAHQVSAGTTETCKGCTDTLPACAHYMNGGNCLWACDKDCYKTGGGAGATCEHCLDNYHTAGSGALVGTACKIDCNSGTYLKNLGDTSCTTCPTGSGSNFHKVSQGETSICPNCGNKPTTCSEYTSYGVGINNCSWQCSKDCYLSGTNKCVACTGSYHTDAAGSTSRTGCKIECGPNKYVAVPGGSCIACPQRTITGQHTVLEGNISPGCVDDTQGCGEDQYNGIIDRGNNACYDCTGGYHSPAGSSRYSDCNTTCDTGWHVATPGGLCELCGTGKTTNGNTTVHKPDSFECTNCPSTSKPAHSHFIANTSDKTCNWACDDTFVKSADGNSCVCPANKYLSGNNKCEPCQNGYTSAPGLGGVNSCSTWCEGGTHVAAPRSGCDICGIGSGRTAHTQLATGTSVCSGCINGPTNMTGFYYIGPGTSITSCPWQCSADYYLSGTSENGSCEPCPPGESSLPGSVGLGACGVDCGPDPSDGYWIPTN